MPAMRKRAYSLLGNASFRRSRSGTAAAVLGAQNVNITGRRHRLLPPHNDSRCPRLSSLAPPPQARLPTHADREACGATVGCRSGTGIRQLSSRSKNNSGSGGSGGGGRNKRAAGGAAPAPPAASNTETNETVITLDGVSKQLPGGRQLFADASLSFVRGAKVGVLGVNGSGKSTVLKIIAGAGTCLEQLCCLES